MKNITELFSHDRSLQEKPWLVIGKGPSYELISSLNLSDYNIFTLNHVIRQHHAKIAHLIDIDVLESCAEEIECNAEYLVMPYYPHYDNKPGKFSLPELLERTPLLKKIDQENRLFWYDQLGIKSLLFGRRPLNFFRQIWVRRFSAEAALGILASQGIKTIRTIGVDGGVNYNALFEASDAHTRLANGRSTFDDQFGNMIRIIMKNNLDFQAIGTNYPIKVYIATQEEQMLAVKVLEYSIKKYATQPVEIFALHQSNITYREPKDPINRQRTPFSFQRFLIPQLNHHKGRAIYLDSDMQVFSDINQLWTLPMGSYDLLTVIPSRFERRRLQFSVMLMDCEKLNWSMDKIIDNLDEGSLSYESLMYEMAVANNIGISIPKEWNCLEWHQSGQSCLVHYTDMHTQPWISTDNALGHLWVKDLIEAIDLGKIDMAMVNDHINKGWIRPSLHYQIEHKQLYCNELPHDVYKLDEAFIAPYKKLRKSSAIPYKNQFDHIWGKLIKVIHSIKQRI